MISVPYITDPGMAEFAWIGLGQFMLAVLTVYSIYRARELSVIAGIVVGVSLPVMIVAAQYYLGIMLFAVTHQVQIQLILLSTVCAGVGLALATTILKPEIDGPVFPNRTIIAKESNDG